MSPNISLEMVLPAETDLLNALATARDFADVAMRGRPRSLMPQLLVYAFPYGAEKRELSIFAIGGEFDGQEKGRILKKIGMGMYTRRRLPTHVALVTEAWLSEDMFEAGRRKYLLPEDDPNRIETITVQLLSLDCRARLNQRTVRRDAGGRLEWDGEWDLLEGVQVKTNLLACFFAGFAAAARSLREA